MNVSRFLYSGPMQTIPLRLAADPARETSDVVDTDFVPGREMPLDPDHAVTIALRDAGFLTEIPAEVIAPAVDLAIEFADHRDGAPE